MRNESGIDINNLKPAALSLLETAESLFAEHGIHAISTREIAREAGQKNHSAVAYHFGDKDQLVRAILAYRTPPINAERAQMLEALLAKGQEGKRAIFAH